MNNYYQQPYNPYSSPYGVANGITWVQGVEGAKAYQMAPSSSAVLMDSEIEGRMYIKTVDNIGISNLRYFQYSEIGIPKNDTLQPDFRDYVTKTEFESAIEEIKEAMNGKQTVSTTRRSETSK